MSSFINLDSIHRKRDEYPNENSYTVDDQQTKTWYRSSRTVLATAQNPSVKPKEFATSVKLVYLSLPYTEELAEFPIVYVNFRSIEYKDIHLIQAISGTQSEAKFVCRFDKIQEDRNGDPLWIHYQCHMEQVMRFRRGDPVVFQVTTRSGSILPQQDSAPTDPPEPMKQTQATFEITPYINDGDYTNQTTTSFVPGQ